MTTLIGSSLGLFMRRVLPARTAKLFGLHAIGVLFLVLRGGVIAILALTTLQGNNFAHFSNPFMSRASRIAPARLGKLLNNFGDRTCSNGVAAFANREAQPLLQSDWGNQRDFAAHVVARHD